MSKWSDESTSDFVSTVQAWWKECQGASREWRLEAREAFRLRAGDWENGQWDEETLAEMDDHHPLVSFNKIDVFCSAVTGLETLNRSQVQFLPRIMGKVGGATDILNGAARYVEEDGDTEFHQSHAFSDMVTSGMGWTETFVDWTTNPDGDLRTEQRDPLQMYWDPNATHRNLRDARRRAHVRRMASEEIMDQWPKVDFEDIASSLFFQDDLDEEPSPHVTKLPQDAYETQQGRSSEDHRDYGYVLHAQWYELTAGVRAIIQGKPQTLTKSEWNEYLEPMRAEFDAANATLEAEGLPAMEWQEPETQPVRQRVYWRAFVCGDKLLERRRANIQEFSMQCLTGRYDRNQRIWYGLVRSLKDPQDWTNKLLGKILYIMQYNSQGGGYFAEEDAFSDPRSAEDSLPRPDQITYLNANALVEGRIKRKDPMPYPQGLDRLMTVSMQAFPEVTGISLELLGLADKVQPGVLEASRKQAGMTTLAWAFDSMKAYRKNYGRVLMEHIQNYLADGRLVRIVGEEGQEFVPLVLDDRVREYDVVVSESPKSTNERERVLALLVQLMPLLRESGIGFPTEALDYLPVPAEMAEKWKAKLQGDPQQRQQQAQMQQAAQQLELRGKQAEVEKDEADARKKETEADINVYKMQTGEV
jgi:hypothetical protein